MADDYAARHRGPEIHWGTGCVPSVRCADRTLCPGPCREAGNREGNDKLPTNPTPDELERYRNSHRRTT